MMPSRLFCAGAVLAMLALTASCDRGESGGQRVFESFPHPVGSALPEQTVAHLYDVAPDVRFSPYDGLHLALREPYFGFRTAEFSTGELFPERPPAGSAKLKEIRLRGDTIDAGVIQHLSNLFADAEYAERCVQRTGANLFVWELAEGLAVELMLSQRPPHRGRMRIFRGGWRGDPLTEKSVAGLCPQAMAANGLAGTTTSSTRS